MSAFANIDKTLRKAVSDLALGYDIVLENQAFDPTTDLSGDVWLELFQLPSGVDSIGKASTDADENVGIFQVSIMTKNVNDGPAEVVGIADLLASEFKHGSTYTDFANVFIQNTNRNNGRIDGGFYRVDVSINWLAYISR